MLCNRPLHFVKVSPSRSGVTRMTTADLLDVIARSKQELAARAGECFCRTPGPASQRHACSAPGQAHTDGSADLLYHGDAWGASTPPCDPARDVTKRRSSSLVRSSVIRPNHKQVDDDLVRELLFNCRSSVFRVNIASLSKYCDNCLVFFG